MSVTLPPRMPRIHDVDGNPRCYVVRKTFVGHLWHYAVKTFATSPLAHRKRGRGQGARKRRAREAREKRSRA